MGRPDHFLKYLTFIWKKVLQLKSIVIHAFPSKIPFLSNRGIHNPFPFACLMVSEVSREAREGVRTKGETWKLWQVLGLPETSEAAGDPRLFLPHSHGSSLVLLLLWILVSVAFISNFF